MAYDLTPAQRERYRETSKRSRLRKLSLLSGTPEGTHAQPGPLVSQLDPDDLMPHIPSNGLKCLSLFSGGGGLDLGFERAGFSHIASVELLDICGDTLRHNRPHWSVLTGANDGDVRNIDFKAFQGVDVVQGGPPCQPFSTAGKQAGENDPRNMWPQFVRCVLETQPRVFVAENVPGLLDKKFAGFVRQNIEEPLSPLYTIFKFKLAAHDFGVPQARRRVFFVGFRYQADAARWQEPTPTHGDVKTLFGPMLPRNTVRKSLGLPLGTFDDVAPTLRSGFTGPRKTTGVINSKASQATWHKLGIWPSGVQRTRAAAAAFTAENGHHRLSVEECALIQGFPTSWKFSGAVYQALGQIGNSVCPPVAYAVARQVARALGDI